MDGSDNSQEGMSERDFVQQFSSLLESIRKWTSPSGEDDEGLDEITVA